MPLKSNMIAVVCCATLEVKYRKRGGGVKVLNENAIQVSDIDKHLNVIMQKPNFKAFLGVRIMNICERPVCSANDEDSEEEDEVDLEQ